MSAPSRRMYADTYGGVIRCPRKGTLTMQKVVTVPVCESSTSSAVGVPSEGHAALGGM